MAAPKTLPYDLIQLIIEKFNEPKKLEKDRLKDLLSLSLVNHEWASIVLPMIWSHHPLHLWTCQSFLKNGFGSPKVERLSQLRECLDNVTSITESISFISHVKTLDLILNDWGECNDKTRPSKDVQDERNNIMKIISALKFIQSLEIRILSSSKNLSESSNSWQTTVTETMNVILHKMDKTYLTSTVFHLRPFSSPLDFFTPLPHSIGLSHLELSHVLYPAFSTLGTSLNQNRFSLTSLALDHCEINDQVLCEILSSFSHQLTKLSLLNLILQNEGDITTNTKSTLQITLEKCFTHPHSKLQHFELSSLSLPFFPSLLQHLSYLPRLTCLSLWNIHIPIEPSNNYKVEPLRFIKTLSTSFTGPYAHYWTTYLLKHSGPDLFNWALNLPAMATGYNLYDDLEIQSQLTKIGQLSIDLTTLDPLSFALQIEKLFSFLLDRSWTSLEILTLYISEILGLSREYMTPMALIVGKHRRIKEIIGEMTQIPFSPKSELNYWLSHQDDDVHFKLDVDELRSIFDQTLNTVRNETGQVLNTDVREGIAHQN